jgi:hypothetical protein
MKIMNLPEKAWKKHSTRNKTDAVSMCYKNLFCGNKWTLNALLWQEY